MPYVTGAQILTHVSKTSPTADETAWAADCAADIEGGIATLLDGYSPTAGEIDQLEKAARNDGAACFNSKNAPHGILSIGPDGDAVRLGSDSLREVRKAIAKVHTTAGIGIG